MQGMIYSKELERLVLKLSCDGVVRNISAVIAEELEEDHMVWITAHFLVCGDCERTYMMQKEAWNAKRYDV